MATRVTKEEAKKQAAFDYIVAQRQQKSKPKRGAPPEILADRDAREILDAFVDKNIEAVLQVLLDEALDGNVDAAKFLIIQRIGLPTNKTEVTGKNGQPLTVGILNFKEVLGGKPGESDPPALLST